MPHVLLVFSITINCIATSSNTVEPPNNGHIGGEHLSNCSEVVPYLEVEMYGQYRGRGQTVCPL